MKRFLSLLMLILSSMFAFCNSPREITKQDSIRILKEVEIYITTFQKQLDKTYSDDLENGIITEFSIDTCKIERIATKKIEIDCSTMGISVAIKELTNQYDKLLNKYYHKLLSKLIGADKETLKQSQRNWIQFRESETKLIILMSDDKYSGGGTIQNNIISANILDLTKKRLVEIYQYLLGITE